MDFTPDRRLVNLETLGSHGYPGLLFNDMYLARGMIGVAIDSWPVDDKTIAPICERFSDSVVFHSLGEAKKIEDVVIDRGELLIRLNLHYGTLTVTVGVATHDLAVAQKAIAAVKTIFPREAPRDDDKIWLTFWSLGKNGPQAIRRKILVPTWADITPNYPSATNGRLASMMSEFEPAHGGQLLLWHGEPGTGKTFALRALGREWRRWCNVEYIVDPDDFFGNASYMMAVLIRLGDEFDEDDNGDVPVATSSKGYASEAESTSEANGSAPWTLLVLEDTGELMMPDAKEQAGQGLSRFLNVADGLIGQGLRVILMVTTNEPLRDLHPAVKRPGRSAQEVEFKKFTTVEAAAWLNAHNVEPDISVKGATLAELYARVHGYYAHTTRRPEIGLSGR